MIEESIEIYEREMRALLALSNEERGRIMGAIFARSLNESFEELPPLENAICELVIAAIGVKSDDDGM
jgi:hypothetical protein